MDRNLTDITMVIDRSGSMQSRREDAEGGVNAFLKDQKEKPGKADVTIYDFDYEYRLVQPTSSIKNHHEYRLHPRGNTALLDAVGRAIEETGARLRALPEKKRPALVVFVIVTDGQENASQKFGWGRVREMISHQQSTYNWQFIFLGEGLDAANQARELAIPTSNFAAFGNDKYVAAYNMVSSKVGHMRGTSAQGGSAAMDFSPEERAEIS